MRIEWSDAGTTSARRFMRDQDGLLAVGLAYNPYPAEAFHRGAYHRLRVGGYRVLYYVDGDLITIERVDRVPQHAPGECLLSGSVRLGRLVERAKGIGSS